MDGHHRKYSDFVTFVAEHVQHVGLREGLIGQARLDNLPFAWEMLARYLAADEAAKLDIEAFHAPMVGSDQTAADRVLELKANDNRVIQFPAPVLPGDETVVPPDVVVAFKGGIVTTDVEVDVVGRVTVPFTDDCEDVACKMLMDVNIYFEDQQLEFEHTSTMPIHPKCDRCGGNEHEGACDTQ